MTATLQAPTSISELLTLSGDTARDLAGADQSAWNGRVVGTSSSILGLAHWDGTLYLDNDAILAPIHHLYEHAGENHPSQTLFAYRESLATLLHEHAHFLGPSGATQEAAREGFVEPGSRQLEEGVTEAWAQDNIDEYINRLGIDKVAPGINTVRSGGYYPSFVPAVRQLAAELETRIGLPSGQVLQDLNRQTAAGQLPLLVDLVYNSTRLPDLEPPGADTRSRLESILRSGLSHLDTYELAAPDLAATKSRLTAENLLAHLGQEIRTAESAYTFNPIHLTPPAQQTALFGIAPPTAPSQPKTSHPSPARTNHPAAARGGLIRTA
ncbi:hypothetical protein GCM10009630_03790 [Kribbella jejuensis]|uniref:Uncharacterized protein n=1 Tax=Kribbella jejuensis TaxID=236068 RepID=A0A542EUQ3_9ACTN|nr:hypothetical protein [Kribbella jejuensis]TQJ18914.1 hypothetical protein FB475_3068 [Kribbella jejuensis]